MENKHKKFGEGQIENGSMKKGAEETKAGKAAVGHKEAKERPAQKEAGNIKETETKDESSKKYGA